MGACHPHHRRAQRRVTLLASRHAPPPITDVEAAGYERAGFTPAEAARLHAGGVPSSLAASYAFYGFPADVIVDWAGADAPRYTTKPLSQPVPPSVAQYLYFDMHLTPAEAVEVLNGHDRGTWDLTGYFALDLAGPGCIKRLRDARVSGRHAAQYARHTRSVPEVLRLRSAGVTPKKVDTLSTAGVPLSEMTEVPYEWARLRAAYAVEAAAEQKCRSCDGTSVRMRAPGKMVELTVHGGSLRLTNVDDPEAFVANIESFAALGGDAGRLPRTLRAWERARCMRREPGSRRRPKAPGELPRPLRAAAQAMIDLRLARGDLAEALAKRVTKKGAAEVRAHRRLP